MEVGRGRILSTDRVAVNAMMRLTVGAVSGFLGAYTDRGASALYFLDAGGNVAELIANDHLDNDSSAPFGPDHCSKSERLGCRPRTPAPLAPRSRTLSRRRSSGVVGKDRC
jgi:hypothetical protein